MHFSPFLADAPSLIVLAVVLLLGTVWGSFISMASYRIPRSEGWVVRRSHCPHCKHSLSFLDLIPVFSWLASGGKCRYCQVGISIRYPLIELSTALLFALVYARFGLTPLGLLMVLVTVVLMVIIVTDLEHYIIPDIAQLILLPLAVLYGIMRHHSWWEMLLGAIAGGATGLALRYIGYKWKKQEALGWGDVKFLVIAGLFLGVSLLPPFFFVAGIAGIATGLFWQISGRGTLFPFGPALVAALFLLLLLQGIDERLVSFLTITNNKNYY